MTVVQALLIALIVASAYLARRIGGDPQLERPIILGPIVGLILGDMHTGLVVGGTLELVFIGAATFGGTAPPNVAIGAAVGTALSIASGEGVQAALVAAVPVAVLGTFCELFAKTVCSFLVHRADAAAADGRGRTIMVVIWIGNAVHFLAYFVPTFLALWLGADAVRSVVSGLSPNVQHALNASAALLPAVGFGILLSVLYSKALYPVFFIGFALAAFTDFTVIGVVTIARRPSPPQPASAPPGALPTSALV
jgi:mannose/fructose/N-acetylgalactosamine-specific phosphotransferase system component IIC